MNDSWLRFQPIDQQIAQLSVKCCIAIIREELLEGLRSGYKKAGALTEDEDAGSLLGNGALNFPAMHSPPGAAVCCADYVASQFSSVFRNRKPHPSGGKKIAALKGAEYDLKHSL
ncbi:hypothetical protein ACFL3A_09350 [Pseudomonadota bacterium]